MEAGPKKDQDLQQRLKDFNLMQEEQRNAEKTDVC